jgi:pimeloyl-ACP methyl ester carboxylesterase
VSVTGSGDALVLWPSLLLDRGLWDAQVRHFAGREDATFPVPEVRELADSIPGAGFVILEPAAHLVALEVLEEANRLVDDFLA